jgi:cation:H+ antiporter
VWPFDFHALPLAANALVCAAASAAVWVAGTRLALYADAIASRTGWGHAVVGLVLLALATDLPELVTSVAAAASGEAVLAVNNLTGGVVVNTAILAVADASFGRGALTFFTPSVRVTLQGLLVVALLSVTLCGAVAGEPVAPFGVGLSTALGFALYLGFVAIAARFDPDERWRPMDLPDVLQPEPVRASPRHAPETLRRLGVSFALASLAILAAGVALVGAASAIADQTGLGEGFVGSTLLATATSLPEVSTTLAAVRIGAYGMAFANVFGSNAVVVALLFVADAVDGGGPILRAAGPSALLGAAAGIGVTAVYLVGLLTRQRKTFLRMGVDPILVLFAYAAVLALLYRMR